MNITVHSNPGKQFYVTEKGAAIGRIKAKFVPGSIHYKHYRYSVPQLWIDNGWVEEREEIADGQQT